jgi:ABC-type multidrug transport system ATPase subunit
MSNPERRAVLISSHILEDITAVADEVALIRNGELVIHAPLADVVTGWRILSFSAPPGRDVRQLVNRYKIIRGRDGSVSLLCPTDELQFAVSELEAVGANNIEIRTPSLREIFLAFA